MHIVVSAIWKCNITVVFTQILTLISTYHNYIRQHFEIYFCYFSDKIAHDISCKSFIWNAKPYSLQKHPQKKSKCHLISITKTCLFKIYWKFYQKKNENFQGKKSDIFHFSAQNIDCGYLLELPHWGSSNEYPQSMFLSRNKKNNVYPYKPQFYYIKVGFKGVKII